MERVGDDRRVDAVGQEDVALFQESARNDDDGGGTVTSGRVLRLGELDEHLGGGLEDLHLVEDGGAVVGDDDLAVGSGDHLVHALGSQAGPDGIGHGSSGEDVGLADVFLALVVDIRLGLGGRAGLGDHCW